MNRTAFPLLRPIAAATLGMCLLLSACSKEETLLPATASETLPSGSALTLDDPATTDCDLHDWNGMDAHELGLYLFGAAEEGPVGALDAYLACEYPAPATSGACCSGVTLYITEYPSGNTRNMPIKNSWGARWGNQGYSWPADDGQMTLDEQSEFAHEIVTRAQEEALDCHGGSLVPATYELSFEAGPDWIEPYVRVTYVPVCD